MSVLEPPSRQLANARRIRNGGAVIFGACGTVVWFHVSVQVIIIYGCCASDSDDYFLRRKKKRLVMRP